MATNPYIERIDALAPPRLALAPHRYQTIKPGRDHRPIKSDADFGLAEFKPGSKQREDGTGGGQIRIHENHGNTLVGRGGGTRVEAEPAQPEDEVPFCPGIHL